MMAPLLTWGNLALTAANGYHVHEPVPFSAAPVNAGAAVPGQPWAVPRQLSRNVGGFWQDNLVLGVTGTSSSDLRAKIAALQAEYQKDSNTLAVLLAGRSAARTVNLVQQGSFPEPVDYRSEAALEVELTIPLTAAPFALGALTTVLNAVSITAPCIVSLGDLGADCLPAPLSITVATPVANVHSLYCGRLMPGSALAAGALTSGLLLEAEAYTSWSAGPGGISDVLAHGGAGVVFAATAATRGYDTASLDSGMYLPLLRAASEGTDKYGDFALSYSAPSGSITTWAERLAAAASASHYQYMRASLLRLPVRPVRGAVAANLVVSVQGESSSAGHRAGLDYIALVPQSWGLVAVHADVSSAAYNEVVFQADGSVFCDGLAYTDGGTIPGPIYAAGPTKLAIFAEDAAGSYPTLGLTLTVQQHPRYASV